MKDRKTIIESGMLEEYFLGTLPEEQMVALEKMLEEDTVLAEKFSEVEADFEKMALENAVKPPSDVKEKIFNTIRENSKVKTLPKTEDIERKNGNSQMLLWIAAGFALLA